MMHFKSRLLIGSSLALSSRGWKCFPAVAAPGAVAVPGAKSAPRCPGAWGSLPWAVPRSRAKAQHSLGVLGFVQVSRLCLPGAISCCSGGLKFPRTGHPCGCCSYCSEPWVLSWPQPWSQQPTGCSKLFQGQCPCLRSSPLVLISNQCERINFSDTAT